MSLVSDWLRLVRRWISSEMSTAESSCTKRSSSMRVSSSAIGCSNSRNVVFIPGSVFYRHRVERAPEIPGGHRAPRPPAFTKLAHARQRNFPSFEVAHADALLQTQVIQGKHVGPQQVEDQEHLRSPAADAAHLDQLGNDLLVGHLRPAMHVNAAVGEMLRQVGDVLGLAIRQAARAQLGSFAGKNPFWG